MKASISFSKRVIFLTPENVKEALFIAKILASLKSSFISYAITETQLKIYLS